MKNHTAYKEDSRKRSRMKTILLNRKDEEVKSFIEKREVEKKNKVNRNPRAQFETKYDRRGNSLKQKNRKELKIERNRNVVKDTSRDTPYDQKKRREKEFKKRINVVQMIKETSLEEKKQERNKANEVREWKEQIARVGTGYRVRKDEKDQRKRRFDVGYADRKAYKRKEGREAIRDTSNIGRTLIGKGPDARVKVMNAVCDMEKRRPASEYTGSGILRKSMVGKIKLKPTKASGKE